MAKTLNGTIVKKSGKNTVKVAVERFVKHPLYKKNYRVIKNYLVDDPGDKHALAETVTIIKTRPISKMKHYKIMG